MALKDDVLFLTKRLEEAQSAINPKDKSEKNKGGAWSTITGIVGGLINFGQELGDTVKGVSQLPGTALGAITAELTGDAAQGARVGTIYTALNNPSNILNSALVGNELDKQNWELTGVLNGPFVQTEAPPDSSEAYKESFARSYTEGLPLLASMGESMLRTGSRLKDPSKYKEAWEQGTLVPDILEDIGNLTIVAGPITKGGSMIARSAGAVRTAEALGKAGRVVTAIEEAPGKIVSAPLKTTAKAARESAAAQKLVSIGDIEGALKLRPNEGETLRKAFYEGERSGNRVSQFVGDKLSRLGAHSIVKLSTRATRGDLLSIPNARFVVELQRRGIDIDQFAKADPVVQEAAMLASVAPDADWVRTLAESQARFGELSGDAQAVLNTVTVNPEAFDLAARYLEGDAAVAEQLAPHVDTLRSMQNMAADVYAAGFGEELPYKELDELWSNPDNPIQPERRFNPDFSELKSEGGVFRGASSLRSEAATPGAQTAFVADVLNAVAEGRKEIPFGDLSGATKRAVKSVAPALRILRKAAKEAANLDPSDMRAVQEAAAPLLRDNRAHLTIRNNFKEVIEYVTGVTGLPEDKVKAALGTWDDLYNKVVEPAVKVAETDPAAWGAATRQAWHVGQRHGYEASLKDIAGKLQERGNTWAPVDTGPSLHTVGESVELSADKPFRSATHTGYVSHPLEYARRLASEPQRRLFRSYAANTAVKSSTPPHYLAIQTPGGHRSVAEVVLAEKFEEAFGPQPEISYRAAREKIHNLQTEGALFIRGERDKYIEFPKDSPLTRKERKAILELWQLVKEPPLAELSRKAFGKKAPKTAQGVRDLVNEYAERGIDLLSGEPAEGVRDPIAAARLAAFATDRGPLFEQALLGEGRLPTAAVRQAKQSRGVSQIAAGVARQQKLFPFEGYEQVSSGSPQTLYAPRGVAAALRDVEISPQRSPTQQRLVNAYDAATQAWVKATLPLRPAWNVGNVAGAAFTLAAYPGAAKHLFSKGSSIGEAAVTGQGLVDATLGITRGIREAGWDQSYGAAVSASSNPILKETVKRQQGPVRRTLNTVADWGAAMNRTVDDRLHQAVFRYIDETQPGLSLEAKVRQANLIAGDMRNLSRFEREVVKRVLPFYPFTRHVFQLTGKILSDNPAMLTRAGWFTRTFNHEEAELPEELRGTIETPFGRYRVGYLNPFEAVKSTLPVVGDESAFGVNPLLNVTGSFFGVNLLAGRELQAPPGQPSRGVSAAAKVAAMQFPQYKAIEQMRYPGMALYDTGGPRFSGVVPVPSASKQDPVDVLVRYMTGLSGANPQAARFSAKNRLRSAKQRETQRRRYEALLRRFR